MLLPGVLYIWISLIFEFGIIEFQKLIGGTDLVIKVFISCSLKKCSFKRMFLEKIFILEIIVLIKELSFRPRFGLGKSLDLF